MSAEPVPSTLTTVPPLPAQTPGRRLRLVAFGAFAITAVAATGAFLYLRSLGTVSTDDAFVRADVTQVSPEVPGRIASVEIGENQPVAAGAVLVRLDDTEYRLRLAKAEAVLADVGTGELRSGDAVSAAAARVGVARERLHAATQEEALQKKLLDAGASTHTVWERADRELDIAQASYEAALRDVEAARSSGGSPEARSAASRADVDEARRQLDATVIYAPVDGFAAKVAAHPGELVVRGQPLLAVVPAEQYVSANFKETDLAELCVGALATIDLDAWPGEPLHGTVKSIGVATGASFSLLPADNPTGNFVKVVQRVPVRISIDDRPADRPLPVGLSSTVVVSTEGCP